ncbi:translation elongation factor Ts [Caminibacter mediatlanticus TB-2]|uniref:Elongation factor Ts n=1 Tax=Caminibacter mediatlanticus TB-2 TaxID=391592 RepID=A0AAI9AGK6_9BACT|nr:translation elongation factor Ts [Caminibacter mediatlanticus]EDM23288.1 elongation factor Ts [Caminibacter mediatlanticus TB-2]QCT94213.1 translation elongation factor Ts [Caminibacter mediatlanticus TB-2]
MANITAAMVKALREKTGAGMMDCKKALVEANGDEEKAIEILRKKGLSKAAKKADRNAAEGRVEIYITPDYKKGSIVEVNCETDFVAKTDEFVEFVSETVKVINTNDINDVESLNKAPFGEGTFEEELKVKIAKIGENIVVRRMATIKAPENGIVNGYIHAGGKVGVLVAAACDKPETCEAIKDTLRDIAMHIAAMKPQYLSPESVPADVIEKEKEIAKAQLLKEGKPENIIDKIIPGKIKKVFQEICATEQEYVKAENKETVAEALEKAAKKVGGSAKLVDFVRFEVGEGLVKNACSMADEVAAALK